MADEAATEPEDDLQIEWRPPKERAKLGKKIDRPVEIDPERPLSTAIRRALQESGLSTYEIAAKAGITPPAIYRFLTGERGLSLDALDKVCRSISLEIYIGRPKKKAAGL